MQDGEAILPGDLCLRIVALVGFWDWVRAWRSVSTGFAREPEWFAAAAPWCRVSIVNADGSCVSDLQLAVDLVGRTSELSSNCTQSPILILMPGVYRGPIVLTNSMSIIGWGRNGAARVVTSPNVSACDSLVHLACSSDLALCNLTVNTELSRGLWAMAVADGRPILSQCSFQGGGIALRGGTPTLSNCLIRGSDGVGVLVESSCSNAVLRNCTIESARTDGIHLDGFAMLHSCSIRRNGRHGLYTSVSGLLPSIIGEGNSFKENGQRISWGQDVYEDAEIYALDF